jgi:hypothetical protein
MKNWIIFILTVVAITTVLSMSYVIKNLKQTIQFQSAELVSAKNEVLELTTKNGQLYYEMETVQVEKTNMKKALDILGLENSELKKMNIQAKNTIAALEIIIEHSSTGQTTVVDTLYIENTDTVYYQKVNPFNDGNLSLYNGRVVRGDLSFDYTYNLALQQIIHKRKKDVIITIVTDSPNAKIIAGKSLTIKSFKKWYEQQWLWGVIRLHKGGQKINT